MLYWGAWDGRVGGAEVLPHWVEGDGPPIPPPPPAEPMLGGGWGCGIPLPDAEVEEGGGVMLEADETV